MRPTPERLYDIHLSMNDKRWPVSRAAKQMTPQQHTLSVRINDTLRLRLERAKELMAARSGKPVSTSEVAKQLLESAREDRLEVVELLGRPTETLLQIRRKGEGHYPLSRAEWAMLAHFVQQGVEALSSKTPNPVSRDSLMAVLDAFLAVYDLRTEHASQWNAVYVGNLPSECRPARTKRAGRSDQPSSDVVRRTVRETRRRLSEWTTNATIGTPLLAGRNLSVLLEDDALADADALNRALRPYWSVLWRLAARGHYALTHQPVREPQPLRNGLAQPPIPSITERGYTLSFTRDQDHECFWLLSFPGALGPRYPIRGYPEMTEFRAMVAALVSHGPTRVWSGAHFFGCIAESEQEGAAVWFRAHDNGITFRVSEEDWQSVQTLVDRACEVPDIRTAWDALALEYGEL